MGMYTELVLKVDLRKNLPENVEEVLQYLFGEGEEPTELPYHPFFSCPRWDAIGSSNSYYHVPKTLNFLSEGYLFSRSDLKNYTDEIAYFLAWVKPYLDHSEGECIGWVWYEEADQPTLINF